MNTPRIARYEDLKGIKELWDICFEDSDSFTDWFFESRFYPSYSACLEENGKIICAIQSYPTTLKIKDKIIPSAMVAGVSTHPDYRSKGIMTKVFQKLLQHLKDCGTVLVAYTPKSFSVYENKGHFASSDCIIATTEFAKGFEFSDSVIYADAQKDLSKLSLCYQKLCATKYSGMIQRSIPDFALKMSDYASDGGKVLAVENGEEFSGYAVFYDTPELLMCEELVWDNENSLQKLLQSALSLAKGKAFTAKLAPDSEVLIPELKIERMQKNILGVIDVQQFLLLFQPNFNVIFSVSDVLLPSNNGVFDFCGNRVSESPHIELSSGRLCQWLCGYKSLKELREMNHIKVFDEKIFKKLDKFFPKTQCFIIDEY